MSCAELRVRLEQLVEQCEQQGHPSIPMRVVLRKGVEYIGSKLPAGLRRGRQGRCFVNAAKLVGRETELTYCEGYVFDPQLPIPIHHAWAVTKDGQVVDVTFKKPEDCFYLGIIFNEQTLYTELARNGVYGLLDTGLANVRLIREIDPELMKWVDEFFRETEVTHRRARGRPQ